MADDGFEAGDGVVECDADANGHEQGHLQEGFPSAAFLGTLAGDVEGGGGDGAEAKECETQKHTCPAAVFDGLKVDPHGGVEQECKKRDVKINQWAGEVKEGFDFDFERDVGGEQAWK